MFNIDGSLHNADWPKRTPDTTQDIEKGIEEEMLSKKSEGTVKKSWVPGYTKKDGTKVAGYESGRQKKVDAGGSQPKQKKQEEVSAPKQKKQEDQPAPKQGGAAEDPSAQKTSDQVAIEKKNKQELAKWADSYRKEELDNRVSTEYRPDIKQDINSDGVADYSKVGVPSLDTPPPPGIPRLPNLTKPERYVEQTFVEWFEDNPDEAVASFREKMASGEIGDGPNVFATDEAKMLHPVYAANLENRAKYNLSLHQTANAIAKRAFVDHLDDVVMNLPEDKRHVLITAGGVAAGKGYSIANNPDVKSIADSAAAVWDSAGEQNSTEMPWVAEELAKRGIKGTYVYVHADPSQKWENPKFGAVERAKGKGRMVDAHLFADSYVEGANNFSSFHESNRDNEDLNFVYIDSTTPEMKTGGEMPESAKSVDRDALYRRSVEYLLGADVPDHIKRGGSMGMRIWGEPQENAPKNS